MGLSGRGEGKPRTNIDRCMAGIVMVYTHCNGIRIHIVHLTDIRTIDSLASQKAVIWLILTRKRS